MRLQGERTITAEEVQATVVDINAQKISKGAGIRVLFAGGMDVKEISAITGIRYNHVYNVVKNEVIINGLEVEKSSRDSENSKKGQILKMLADGKTLNEIAVELKCLYNYVWQVAKGAGVTNKQLAGAEVIAAAEKVAAADAIKEQAVAQETPKKNRKAVKTA